MSRASRLALAQARTASTSWSAEVLMAVGKTWEPYARWARAALAVAVAALIFNLIAGHPMGAVVQVVVIIAAWQLWQAMNMFRETALNGRPAEFAEAIDGMTRYFRLMTVIALVTGVIAILGAGVMVIAALARAGAL